MQNDKCLCKSKEGKKERRHMHQEENHVKTGSEIKAVLLQAKEHLDP